MMTPGEAVSCKFLLFRLCLIGLAFVPVIAAAQPRNMAAQVRAEMPADEWLENEAQALAIDRHDDLRNMSMAPPERALAEIALRRLERGDAAEQVAADTRSLREMLQDACVAGMPVAGLSGYLFCRGAATALRAPPVWAAAAGGFCAAWVSSKIISVCSKAERNTGLVPRPTSETLRGFKADEIRRSVWEEGEFRERTNVGLDDRVATVMDKHPQLGAVLSEHGIDLASALEEGVDDQEEALQRSSLDGRKRSQEILPDLVDGIGLSATDLATLEAPERANAESADDGEGVAESADSWAVLAAVENAEQERLRKRTDMANARTALGGAVALIGLAGPEAQNFGRQTLAVADAALGVQGAVDAFNAAAEIGASTSLASLALSGNLVSVGLGLIGSVIDTGPSADEIIIEEIGKLRAQVEDLRVEMHDRFDGVHEHLDRVVERLDTGFELLSEDIAYVSAQLEDVQSGLQTLGANVDRLALDLAYTYVNLSQDHAQLMEAVTGTDTIQCTDASRSSVSEEFLHRCRAHFQNLANLVAGDQTGVTPGSESGDIFLADLEAHPDRTANASLGEFKRLLASSGGRLAGLPRAVVGPEAWIEVMNKQSESAILFSDDAERLGVDVASAEFVATMRSHRSDLREYLRAVEEELRVFTGIDEQRETVFSAQFGEVRAQLARLRDLIGSIQDDYYADDALFDGRTRPAAEVDGAVIPEIRYEDHPHAWNRMADFYSADEFPEWLQFRQHRECIPVYEEDGRRVIPMGTQVWIGPRRFFHGSQVLGFVHRNDLMPARLGIGEIEVCAVTGGTSLNGSAARLAVTIWFRPENDQDCPQAVLFHEVAQDAADGRRLIPNLVLDIQNRARERGPVLIGRENASSEAAGCVEGLYNERFEAKRQALSDYVRSRLEDNNNTEFAEITRAMKIANRHLQSWLALPLDDARWRSGVIEDVLSGVVEFADLERLVRDGQGYAWDMVEEALGRAERLEEILSSRRMRDAVRYGSGHRYLTKARFVSLDGPADESALASR